MKISSITETEAFELSACQHESDKYVSSLKRTLDSVTSTLNRMGQAIALGEAGDLEGAQKLRESHGTN